MTRGVMCSAVAAATLPSAASGGREESHTHTHTNRTQLQSQNLRPYSLTHTRSHASAPSLYGLAQCGVFVLYLFIVDNHVCASLGGERNKYTGVCLCVRFNGRAPKNHQQQQRRHSIGGILCYMLCQHVRVSLWRIQHTRTQTYAHTRALYTYIFTGAHTRAHMHTRTVFCREHSHTR